VIFHFVWSMLIYQWARFRGYRVIATPEIMDWRQAKCTPCDFFKDGQCQACGCLVVSKIMLLTERCPKRRWNRIWVKKEGKISKVA